MPVPSHILSVPRPVNTVVEDRKTDSPKRYAVRARDGYTRSASGHIAPKNGEDVQERKLIPQKRQSPSGDAADHERTQLSSKNPGQKALSLTARGFSGYSTRNWETLTQMFCILGDIP